MAERSPPDLPESDPAFDRWLTRSIADWFASNARDLPWRIEPRDPWLSLMSEIMLQQTQVARVAERFGSFAASFPTPRAMAERPLDDVLALWSGLGYYRRARLLHACASAIVERHEGKIPATVEALHDLPGVGRYTAGAVASIAYGVDAPIVDGNVSRVLLRVHGVEASVDGSGVQAWAWSRASELARAAGGDVARASEGIMELGATVCTPAVPRCDACPVRARCKAHQRGAVDRIPLPKKRAPKKPLSISALVVTDRRNRVLLEQRPPGGLWGSLWQPPSIERAAARHASLDSTVESLGLAGVIAPPTDPASFGFATTHRDVKVRVWASRATHAGRARAARGKSAAWFTGDELGSLGMASAHRRMLFVSGIATSGPRAGQTG
ncbi:MAG: A/G-specific adenine glycosylase [Phycisphaerales bacterium]